MAKCDVYPMPRANDSIQRFEGDKYFLSIYATYFYNLLDHGTAFKKHYVRFEELLSAICTANPKLNQEKKVCCE